MLKLLKMDKMMGTNVILSKNEKRKRNRRFNLPIFYFQLHGKLKIKLKTYLVDI